MLGDLVLTSAMRLRGFEARAKAKPRWGGRSRMRALSSESGAWARRASDSRRVASRRVCRFKAIRPRSVGGNGACAIRSSSRSCHYTWMRLPGAIDRPGPMYLRVDMTSPRARAKLFRHGGSQAVRLPRDYRLPGKEAAVSRTATGGVL